VTSNRDAAEWYFKGNDLSASRKFDEAIANYDRALEIDHDYFDAWIARGNALVNQGVLYDEALESYSEAIEIDPASASAWYNKGVALLNLNKCEEAL
jgi:tetratricopeptide (TPR) repeat protein